MIDKPLSSLCNTDAWKNPKQRELKVDKVHREHEHVNLRCMEKSQTKGIESYSRLLTIMSASADAWKNPKQRELKAHIRWAVSNTCIADAWKNPKQRELKGYTHNIFPGISKDRCMEKSQTKGIERGSYLLSVCLSLLDAWKNPKQRELKVNRQAQRCAHIIIDAWKNPKQRELKATISSSPQNQ